MDINFSELKKATANTQTLNQGLLSGLEKAIQYTQIRNQSFLGSLPKASQILRKFTTQLQFLNC